MADDPKQRPQRWTRILLILSLALNVAIIAFAAGLLLRGPTPHAGVNPLAIDGFRAIFRAMAPEDQREMRTALRNRRDELRRARREMTEIREEMLTVLSADDYSEVALAEVFARQDRLHGTLSTGARQAFFEQVAQMDPESRQAFAARLREELEKRRKPHRR